MTLVLSTNPFRETIVPEDAAEVPSYPTLWDAADSYGDTSPPGPALAPQEGERGASPPLTGPPLRGVEPPLTAPRVSCFKRKCTEEEVVHRCSHQPISVLEERAHILYMSLEKLKSMDDPEVYLRRAVLINNLMKRVHGDILRQSAWCFPTCPLGSTSAQDWLLAQDCHHQKRVRVAKEEWEKVHTCCLYQECGGHCLSVPLCISTPVTSASSVSSSSSSSCPSLPTPSPPLPFSSCSAQADLDMGPVPLFKDSAQMPTGGVFAVGSRSLGVPEKTKFINTSSEGSQDGGTPSPEASQSDLEIECPGLSYGSFEPGSSDRRPVVSECWRRPMVRREAVSFADRPCWSSGM